MREDFLHFIWKTQKFQKSGLITSTKEEVVVLQPGQYNTSSGPDFFNARVRIANQEWAGNLEIHLKSSDWYVHGQENDINYSNVILHVVWEDNVAIHRKDGSIIPTVALKNVVNSTLLHSYEDLVQNSKKKFINCEKDIASIDEMLWYQWQERLFVERLEQKSQLINSLLLKTKNDWENVLFRLLMKTFGLNKNGGAFLAMAEHINDGIFRKVSKNTFQMEALIYGLAGFLQDNTIHDAYYQRLKNEFSFLNHKFQLAEYFGATPIFFGLRPSNFPTVRLSQLCNIYKRSDNLFSALMAAETIDDFYNFFEVGASPYWDTHFTFGKESKKHSKKLTKNFVHLILINAILPLRFCYGRYLGRSQTDTVIQLMHHLPAEKISIVTGFDTIEMSSSSAFESQSKIHLFTVYCKENSCLHCRVGNQLLGRNN